MHFAPRVAATLALLVLTDCASAPRTRSTVAAPARLAVSGLEDTLRSILTAGVRDSAFPGAIVVVGNRNDIILSVAAGHLDWRPSPAPDLSTLWDLASLTKVAGLTSAMMLLVESGQVDLDAKVSRYIPEFTGRWKDGVTIRHLLTHSSGLPAWRPLYKEAESPADAMALAIATPLDTTPGIRMVYSDLGLIILGDMVRRVSGRPLDAFLQERVFKPLGMSETLYRPDSSLLPRIAPTEVDPWRQRHLRGEVHDENAFALGGVSGHAGLFSTGRDLVRLARMYLGQGVLDGHRFIGAATIDSFTTVQDSTLSRRALGWETPNGTNSAGRLMSPRSFGHTGFTGTSLWVDRDRGIFVILLSNRVNPTREHRGITAVRTAVADAVTGAVLK
jgi:CubicO group peptidase (beta-lactamase class C family)